VGKAHIAATGSGQLVCIAPGSAAHLPRTASIFPGIIRGHFIPGRMDHDLASPDTILVSELATIERVVDFVATRHHLRPADAADFASHVTMKLVENDYAILRKFERRSSLRTYLNVVIQRLFLDYSVAKWGKWRPSAPAKRAGEIGIMLERLLVRDGYSVDEAYEVLVTNHRMNVDRREVERIAGRLPARAKRQFESDASLVDRADDAPGADALAEHNDRIAFAQRVSAALKRLLAALDPQDRLILVLLYVDGRSVAEIASTLNLDQKRLYRRKDQLHAYLLEGLESEGISADDALAIFEDPTVTVDWWP
jgi:RNA polymerase sigma factor (sigma-70 family)